ncbi:MAG TPA: sigma-54 dependent transcriptional regulator [Chitinophagaceae bacterium]|nr:sigma-54 dependent transcriptional regulator [Chitinophagaceae bacterium]
MQKILVVDDDKDMCSLLERFLSKHGFEVIVSFNGKRALEVLEENNISLVLTDFRLEDMDGKTLLTKIKKTQPDLPIIIITGYSDIKIAVEVIKIGAFDYVTKPLFPDEILIKIKEALSSGQPATAKEESPEPHVIISRTKEKPYITHGQYIFGDSPAFKKILNQILLVAPTNYSVIIYGETGVGKEVIANEIHNHSKRKDKPFVAIDCGALSKELAGSELFGHEKGSFTGAVNQKIGSFEIANGGTIFLDEVANLSYDIQISLLRVVQERKMRRVGGTKDIDLDVRIIVASNEGLWTAEKKGNFREDLFHRFNEFSIEVPPLRERRDDILLFAQHFLMLTNKELGKNVKGFTPEAEKALKSYPWYGNLRELKNVVKRATLLSDSNYIEVYSLPFEISHFNKLQFDRSAEENMKPELQEVSTMVPVEKEESPVPAVALPGENNFKKAVYNAEFKIIMDAMAKVNFNKSEAARLLNIDRKTLYNKLKQYTDNL